MTFLGSVQRVSLDFILPMQDNVKRSLQIVKKWAQMENVKSVGGDLAIWEESAREQ